MLKLVIIVVIVILVLLIILNYKRGKSSKIYIRILYVILFVVIVFPFNSIQKKFDSFDDAFNYYYSDYLMIDKYKLDNEYLIFYGDRNHTLSFAKFTENDDKWKLSSYFLTNIKTKVVYNGECVMSEYFPGNDKVALYVKCDSSFSNNTLLDNSKEYSILNSNLETLKNIEFEDNTYYGLFNKDDYILINDDRIYLDKK